MGPYQITANIAEDGLARAVARLQHLSKVARRKGDDKRAEELDRRLNVLLSNA